MNAVAGNLIEVTSFTIQYFIREPCKKQQGTNRRRHPECKRQTEKVESAFLDRSQGKE